MPPAEVSWLPDRAAPSAWTGSSCPTSPRSAVPGSPSQRGRGGRAVEMVRQVRGRAW